MYQKHIVQQPERLPTECFGEHLWEKASRCLDFSNLMITDLMIIELQSFQYAASPVLQATSAHEIRTLACRT